MTTVYMRLDPADQSQFPLAGRTLVDEGWISGSLASVFLNSLEWNFQLLVAGLRSRPQL